jgi:hypothetical protein
MFKPALAALAFAAIAAASAPAEAHDSDASRYGLLGAPFFYEFAHRYDDRDGRYDRRDRYDRGRDVERHFHYKKGKRVVHAHPFRKGHDHGRGWSDAKRFKEKKKRYVRGRDHDRRDYWRWRQHREEANRHDHRREAQRHDGRRHDHDARDHNHRRDAQRHDGRDRDWRDSRRDGGTFWQRRQRD